MKTFAPYPNAVIVRGCVPDTLSAVRSERIAFLSIDMNSAAPEVAAVRTLWPRLSPGAVVLLDDYAGGPAYREQEDAHDALAAELNFEVLARPTGHGMVVQGTQ